MFLYATSTSDHLTTVANKVPDTRSSQKLLNLTFCPSSHKVELVVRKIDREDSVANVVDLILSCRPTALLPSKGLTMRTVEEAANRNIARRAVTNGGWVVGRVVYQPLNLAWNACFATCSGLYMSPDRRLMN
eukprot:g65628.t1